MEKKLEAWANRDNLSLAMLSASNALKHILLLEAEGQISRGEAIALYHMVLSDAMYTVIRYMMPELPYETEGLNVNRLDYHKKHGARNDTRATQEDATV